MKKKAFKWDNFEDIIRLLFSATEKTIECDYGGDKSIN